MAAALLLSCLLLGAAPSQTLDPGLKGPFEVGFTHYLLIDTSRPGDAFGVHAHRPIPVYLAEVTALHARWQARKRVCGN